MRMPADAPLEYRGFTIDIQVQLAEGGVFGHADLYANREFKARFAVGSTYHDLSALRRRLRCLAKSKVDVWSIAGRV